jgi:hypothetical protein
VAVSVRVGLLAHPRAEGRGADLSAQHDALREHLVVLEETSRSQAAGWRAPSLDCEPRWILSTHCRWSASG